MSRRILTRALIVLFSLLRAPLVVAPLGVIVEPVWESDTNTKLQLPGYWR